jgi:hypothetical protein
MSNEPGHGGSDGVPPDVLYVGCIRGKWPMHIMSSPAHVTSWLQSAEPNYERTAWKVTGFDLTRMELIPAVPAKLVEISE